MKITVVEVDSSCQLTGAVTFHDLRTVQYTTLRSSAIVKHPAGCELATRAMAWTI
jgi:hypothetical protein